MKVYQVEIEEILQKLVKVKANSEDEAIDKVRDRYKDCIYVLDYEDFKEVTFNIYKDEKE